MSVRQQIIDLLTASGPMTQREMAEELGLDVDLLRGYIGALRQRRPGVLYVHSYRRDEDGGRLYPRALWAVGDKPDAKRIKPLPKAVYNKRGKDKMKTRVASVFHLGVVNKTNQLKAKLLRDATDVENDLHP
jgi:hypothetical protein